MAANDPRRRGVLPKRNASRRLYAIVRYENQADAAMRKHDVARHLCSWYNRGLRTLSAFECPEAANLSMELESSRENDEVQRPQLLAPFPLEV